MTDRPTPMVDAILTDASGARIILHGLVTPRLERLARTLERDRAELIEHLRGVMGLVQLLGHAHDSQATKNHRYVDADALLSRLQEGGRGEGLDG